MLHSMPRTMGRGVAPWVALAAPAVRRPRPPVGEDKRRSRASPASAAARCARDVARRRLLSRAVVARRAESPRSSRGTHRAFRGRAGWKASAVFTRAPCPSGGVLPGTPPHNGGGLSPVATPGRGGRPPWRGAWWSFRCATHIVHPPGADSKPPGALRESFNMILTLHPV